MVRQALPPAEIARLLRCSEDLDALFRERMGASPTERLNLLDAFGAAASAGLGEPLLELLTCPAAFPKVFGLLGYNISLYHTQLSVSPPLPPGTERKRNGWHRAPSQPCVCWQLSQAGAACAGDSGDLDVLRALLLRFAACVKDFQGALNELLQERAKGGCEDWAETFSPRLPHNRHPLLRI